MLKVRPIGGDDPGLCDIQRAGAHCNQEAVVTALVLVPGPAHVTVKFCRIDWADAVEAEEADLRKPKPHNFEDIANAALGVHEQNGNMTLGVRMRDDD